MAYEKPGAAPDHTRMAGYVVAEGCDAGTALLSESARLLVPLHRTADRFMAAAGPRMTPEEGASDRQRSGIKVIRNTKGWGFEVHLYAGDTDPNAIGDLIASMTATVKALNEKYPREGE